MPETKPLIPQTNIAGSTLESGAPNTGQLPYSFGGSKTFSQFSGLLTDLLIQAGGGRLEQASLIPSADNAASGPSIIFYDSAIVVSGGPLNTSGHKVLAVLKAANVASGVTQAADQRDYSIVYTSGLCVTQASGAQGFTCTYIPVTSG